MDGISSSIQLIARRMEEGRLRGLRSLVDFVFVVDAKLSPIESVSILILHKQLIKAL